jgi:hypothetical protein
MSGLINSAGGRSGLIGNTEVTRQEVKYPIRVRGGDTIVDSSGTETFSYTSGGIYLVEVACNAGSDDTKSTGEEIWRINSNDSVEELLSYTGTIAPSISVVGSLIVTCTGQRGVQSLTMYRIG